MEEQQGNEQNATEQKPGEQNTENQAAEQGNQESSGQSSEEQAEQEWFIDDGIKGVGPKPEYFNDKKYKTLSAQAKAQRELEKKLGGFTGAPDEYEVKVSDLTREKGIELSKDDPLITEFIEIAKKNNMNQELFSECVELAAQMEVARSEAQSQYIENEMKNLGKNAQKRIDDLQAWGAANLPEDMQEGFRQMFSTAATVEVAEQIIGKLLEKGVSPQGGYQASQYTEADVQEMQFKTNEFGQRLIEVDPAFRKKYEDISSKVRGTHEARKSFG